MAKGQKYHCGPVESPKGIRRVLSFNKTINELCRLHDEGYEEDSNLTRAQADNVFRSFYKTTGNLILKLLGRIYYVVVTKNGEKHYKGGKK